MHQLHNKSGVGLVRVYTSILVDLMVFKMINLLEGKEGKNLHLEHIEDEILNFGVNGGRFY